MALVFKVAGRRATGWRNCIGVNTRGAELWLTRPISGYSLRQRIIFQARVSSVVASSWSKSTLRTSSHDLSDPSRPQRLGSSTGASISPLGRHCETHIATNTYAQIRCASTSSTPPPSPLRNPIKSLKQLTPHENIYTIPNILTFTRLIAAPAVGYFILTSQPIAAFALFAYAGITDLVDGYLARRLQQFTVVGSVIDPMADKLLMTVCVLSLGYVGTFPWWLVVIIFGRDFALAISAIWWRWISLPPPKTMTRYWDFSLPSAEVHPTEISKINTLLQMLLVANAMMLPVLPEALTTGLNLWGIQIGWEYLVAGTTLWSGLSYIGNKDAVKILTQQEVQQKMDERRAETNVEEQTDERVKTK